MELIDSTGVEISGKNCVVIGRSNIVGKPMSMLLLHRSGTVTICHSKTQNLTEICKNADILVAAVGKANFVTADMVKEGAVAVSYTHLFQLFIHFLNLFKKFMTVRILHRSFSFIRTVKRKKQI